MDIKGKNILITGGANGIGQLLTEKFVEKGANVGIIDIDEAKLLLLKQQYDNLWVRSCDISNSKEVEQTIDEFFNIYDQIDILINNAAFIYNSPLINLFGGFKKHSIEMWDNVIATDLNAVFYTTVNVVEKMLKKRTKGLILNVSSVCANGNPGQGAYSAAKAGVEALTVAWAKELGAMGIRWAAIAPGYVETDTTMNSLSESRIKEIKNKTPLRRFSKPDEIYEGIEFIIKNDFFNGKMLQLDGGLII